MEGRVSVSIDVGDCGAAVAFYTGALGCSPGKQYSDKWAVVSMGPLDIHIQEKSAGSTGAGEEQRRYSRHWTPVHLDFTVGDVRAAVEKVTRSGGTVEQQSFSEQADIAMCADPFGNGFCLIRE